MRGPVRVYVTLALLTLWVTSASAQTAPSVDRFRVSINYGYQPSSTTFTASASTPTYLENATFDTSYGVSGGAMFDGGLVVRVVGGLGVGVSVSSFTKQQGATVTGTIPHPFFYNTPRSISGPVSSERHELTTHVQVAYVIASKRLDVVLYGGPSFFDVNQDLVSNVAYTETYPYDTATFKSATTVKESVTKMGFNVGADIGFKLSKHFGVGGLFRYSHASLTFPLAGSAAAVNADAGGPQVGGGVRLFF